MADITKAVSANDIKNGTSVTGVDGTGNVQTHFEAAKDSTSPSLSDIQNKYDTRFDDIDYYFFTGDDPLLTGLVGYYRLDETSGTRLDAANGKDLSDNNTVGYVSGVDSSAEGTGNAANFVRANNEYLSFNDPDEFRPGNTDFSIAFWFKLSSANLTTDQHVWGVWKTAPSDNREYFLFWKGGHKRMRFYTSEDGATDSSYLGSDKNNFVADTWYHMVVCHDAGNDQRLMYIDGDLDNSDSYSGGVYQGDGTLNLGSTQNSTANLDGAIDEWGFWSRVLSAAEAAELYNSGDGKQVK